jgi:hypothetical protein
MKLQLAYQSVQPVTSKPVYNLASLPVTWFDVPEQDVEGLEELTLNCERQDGNQVMRKMSGDIKFYNSTKDLLLTNFYDNNAQYMWVRFYDCECGVWIFKGQITRDKIEWCTDNCYILARATEYDDVTDAYLSLNNVLDYDTYKIIGEKFLNFPIKLGLVGTRYKYQEGARIGGLLSATIANQPNFIFASGILNSTNSLNGWTGDNYNYTPAGHSYQSNLNPYYHAYLLNNDVSKPLKEADIGNKIRLEHRYVKTTKQFLEQLKPIFNADYLLKSVGGVVQFIFERKDYFYYNSVIWKDCTDYQLCFEIDNRNMFAYANMQWQMLSAGEDDLDTATFKELYNDIVEWNNPVNPIQKDEYGAYCSFGWMPLFGHSDYTTSNNLYDCLALKGKSVIAPPSICIAGYNTIDFSNEFNPINLGQYDSSIYASAVHKANSAMWFNGNYRQAVTDVGKDNLWANISIYSGNGLSNYEDCNLYDNFHFIENPRNVPNHRGVYGKYQRKWLKYSLTIDFSCAEYLSYQNDSAIMINVFGTPTKAIIESIEFNFKDRTARITGII